MKCISQAHFHPSVSPLPCDFMDGASEKSPFSSKDRSSTLTVLAPPCRANLSGRPDILVDMEKIAWIVFGFKLREACIVLTIRRFHAIFAFIHDHVDVT